MPNARGLHRCLAADIVVAGKPACSLDVPHRLLACPRHWGMISQDAQRQLWRSYRRAPTGDGRAVLSATYLTAVDRCRDELRVKLDGVIGSLFGGSISDTSNARRSDETDREAERH